VMGLLLPGYGANAVKDGAPQQRPFVASGTGPPMGSEARGTPLNPQAPPSVKAGPSSPPFQTAVARDLWRGKPS
jgi:hypothetical protein